MRTSFSSIIPVEEDGIFIGEPVGDWSEVKYNLLGIYCDIFTASMHKKKNLIYIDLFSGSGFSKIEGSNRIIKSSPLIALSVPIKFNKYIFCEKDKKLFEALDLRISKYYNECNIKLFNDDCNEIIDKIVAEISKENTLCFCFADPYKLKDLHFKTIRKLGIEFRIDFLISIATGMDAKRNADQHYIKENNKVIENFLDDSKWREKYDKIKSKLSFIQFLAKEYESKMSHIGYQESKEFQQVKMRYRNVPLYHLAFYSKHELGNKFWGESKKYKDTQTELF